MRILPLAIIGLALLAGCSNMGDYFRGPAAPESYSGSAATMSGAPAQGDSIDRFAAAYAAQHRMGRY